MSEDKAAPVVSEGDALWFVDQVRLMFPESPELVEAWGELLEGEFSSVLRRIVSDA